MGYTDTNDAIRKHCKYPELHKAGEMPGLGISNRGMHIIPERDIYRLVMRSKLPSAMKFEEWVVGDVLPFAIKPAAPLPNYYLSKLSLH